jgi:dCTP deaminase
MILSDGDIYNRINKGELVIVPVDSNCIQPAGYDLHLHEDILVYAHHVNLTEGDFVGYDWQYPDRDNSQNFLPAKIHETGFALYPGQAILGRSIERLTFPDNIVGKLDGVSSNGRIFLIVHSTAGKFDPGFEGTATLEIANLSPRVTVLTAGMRIAQMEFHLMTGKARYSYRDSGRYQDQLAPTPTRDPRPRTQPRNFGT